jgi:serine/threonine protein kinase
MERSENWERLKELFDEAVLLEPDQRTRLLDKQCKGDDELRRHLRDLLRAHDAAADFLASPTGAIQVTDAASPRTRSEEPGSMIGPYKILQLIGEGGMGMVYMAEQQHPIARKVALKIIKHGMDTRQVIARFEAEQQALALMDHPNIARVFDAGSTQAGRPYFVMELVHGIPITDYCDRNSLPNQERLRLFQSVCHGVQHAHQKGIIHRDLKPGNILVTLHDGRPVPKIIDFGIAKATSARLTERTLFTQYGHFIGTPEYMSPEQAEMSGLDVDTRSDIYSLGALLYELLTGQRLFDPQRLRALAYGELQRVIRDEEPAKPSTRASGQGPEITQAAQHRGLGPGELGRALRGEPDWIVMKALSKDRTRRYDSAGAFAADIERYLSCEPVSAGPPGTVYRVSKFLKRHRVAAGMTAVVLAALILGGALATVGLVRARRAEAVAQREATIAALDAEGMRALVRMDGATYEECTRKAVALRRIASARAPQALTVHLVGLVSFLSALDEEGWTDPKNNAFRKEFDTEAVERVLAMDAAEDSVSLELVDVMIKYAQRFRRESIVPLLRKSVALRSQGSGADRELADVRKQLFTALRDEGQRLLADGRPTDARPLLEESLGLWRTFPLNSSERSNDEGSLGACLLETGEYAAAESLLLEAWSNLHSREQLLRVIDLYRRWGEPEIAQKYADSMVVDAVRELGPLPSWALITTRELCYSGVFRGRSVWLFGRTGVAAGDPAMPLQRRGPGNTWCWSVDRDASDGITLQQPVDQRGVPRTLIPYTPAEVAHLAADSTLEIGLDPGPMIEDPARRRALVVYTKNMGKKFTWGSDGVGSSFAVWTDPDSTLVRPALRPGTAEPTLLFQTGELVPSTGAVVRRDTLYLYATKPVFCSNSVMVARAPLARALERDAWRFYGGQGRWMDDWRQAVEVMQGSPHLSVHWNAYLRKYIAITNLSLSDGIELRTADRPEGPWSGPQVIASGAAPPREGLNNWAAVAHPEFARDGGKTEYLTYRHPIGDFSHEIRLMEIVLH